MNGYEFPQVIAYLSTFCENSQHSNKYLKGFLNIYKY